MQTPEFCPVVEMIKHGASKANLLELVGSNWEVLLLDILIRSPSNYTHLHAETQLNPKLLASALSELVDKGLVVKRTLSYRPKRVSYSITKAGRKIIASGCPFLDKKVH